uniref:Uncharacterized protein n=1 Tax=Kalanchoe fedtschenkoi TaxID=63787 RepID=A0A7N0TDZ9_KALFE
MKLPRSSCHCWNAVDLIRHLRSYLFFLGSASFHRPNETSAVRLVTVQHPLKVSQSSPLAVSLVIQSSRIFIQLVSNLGYLLLILKKNFPFCVPNISSC